MNAVYRISSGFPNISRRKTYISSRVKGQGSKIAGSLDKDSEYSNRLFGGDTLSLRRRLKSQQDGIKSREGTYNYNDSVKSQVKFLKIITYALLVSTKL